MADNFQIVFTGAGDSSPAAQKSVADKIAAASKTPADRLLAQIQAGPFVYKRGLPRAKADAIANTLNKLGAITEVAPDGAPVSSAPNPGGFGFGPPSPAGSASPAGSGFDFGAPPATPGGGGFDFGTPPTSAAPPSAVSYDFETAPASPAGGNAFGFGGGQSSGEFSIEDPGTSAPPPTAGGGFDFSVGAAAPAAPPMMAAQPVGVESNLDYAAASGTTHKAPPPKQKAPKPRTVDCPRCGQSVPEAEECASCGVMMAKAGDAGASASGQVRRPRTRGAAKKSPLKTILIAAGALVVVVVIAFLGGFLNPIRLKLDASANQQLSAFGASVGAPVAGFASAAIGDADRVTEMLEGFVGRGQRIEAEIDRMSKLTSVTEFDQAAATLKLETVAYLSHPAQGLREEIRRLVGPYYPVQGVGLQVGANTYTTSDEVGVARSAGVGNIIALLSDVEIRRRLDETRRAVVVQEEQRMLSERSQAVNVDFFDNFESGALGGRWQPQDGVTPQFTGGWLYLTADSSPPARAPRVLVPEPEADYVVTATISGTPKDAARGGLVIIESDRRWVALARTTGRRQAQVVQMMSQAGAGSDASVASTVTVQIERKGDEYIFSYWDQRRLVTVDRVRPFPERHPRFLGLAAFNGTSGFFFDEFRLTMSR